MLQDAENMGSQNSVMNEGDIALADSVVDISEP